MLADQEVFANFGFALEFVDTGSTFTPFLEKHQSLPAEGVVPRPPRRCSYPQEKTRWLYFVKSQLCQRRRVFSASQRGLLRCLGTETLFFKEGLSPTCAGSWLEARAAARCWEICSRHSNVKTTFSRGRPTDVRTRVLMTRQE